MGRMNNSTEEPSDVCGECGAPLGPNDDGKLECTADVPCLRQVEAEEQSSLKPTTKTSTETFDPKMRKAIKKMKSKRVARRR